MHEAGVAQMAAVLVGAADPEVVGLEARLRDAQLNADVAALDALLAETLLFTGPDGTLGTKQQDLAAHGSGAVRFREHVPEELRVRRVGSDVAVGPCGRGWGGRWAGRWCAAPTGTRGCGRGKAAGRGASSAGT
jgi:Domain of unknown function (DUF4440)